MTVTAEADWLSQFIPHTMADSPTSAQFRDSFLSDTSAVSIASGSASPDPLPLEGIEVVRAEGRIETLDGEALYWWSLTPMSAVAEESGGEEEGESKEKKTEPVAVATLVFTHGYDDYTFRYQELLSFMAERGVATYAVDLRGHGKSTGPRVTISSFQEYTSDFGLFIDFVRERDGDRPIFLMGHSNGGLVLAKALVDDHAHQHGVAGAVFMSPYLELAVPVDVFTSIGARLASLLFPGLVLDNPTQDPALLSTDPDAAAGVKGPEGSSGKVSVRWVTESEKAQKVVMERAGDIVVPCVVLIGGDDPVAGPAAGRRFFASLSSKDKTLLEYPGLRHELDKEIGKERIMAKLLGWIKSRASINMTLQESDDEATASSRGQSMPSIEVHGSGSGGGKRRKVGGGGAPAGRERMISAGEAASHEYKEALVAAVLAE